MALHLITGYAGVEHVTSADQGAYNMGTFGEGEFVLDRGSKFAATIASNNSITIANGEALMQGRFIKLPVGTTESVAIDNGTSGMKRKDLIVLRYTKNASTGVETVAFAVKKGTPVAGEPFDPSVTTGNITDGNDLVNEMKLYRVNLNGINIASLDTLFSVKPTMVEYMDEYQLPVATSSVLGGVKAYSNNQTLNLNDYNSRIYIDDNGILKLQFPTIRGDYEGATNVYALSSATSIPAGLSYRTGAMYLSLSASNAFKQDLESYRIPRKSWDENFQPRHIALKAAQYDSNPIAFILWHGGICVTGTSSTSACYIYSGGMIIYNPSTESKTANFMEIGY